MAILLIEHTINFFDRENTILVCSKKHDVVREIVLQTHLCCGGCVSRCGNELCRASKKRDRLVNGIFLKRKNYVYTFCTVRVKYHIAVMLVSHTCFSIFFVDFI
jgi:hypothetical protein